MWVMNVRKKTNEYEREQQFAQSIGKTGIIVLKIKRQRKKRTV